MEHQDPSCAPCVFRDEQRENQKSNPKNQTQQILWLCKILDQQISIVRGKIFAEHPQTKITCNENTS